MPRAQLALRVRRDRPGHRVRRDRPARTVLTASTAHPVQSDLRDQQGPQEWRDQPERLDRKAFRVYRELQVRQDLPDRQDRRGHRECRGRPVRRD